jgi:hypothetical protein
MRQWACAPGLRGREVLLCLWLLRRRAPEAVEVEVLVHEGCSHREVIQGVDAGLLVLRSTVRRCRGSGHDGRPAGMTERCRVI